MKAVTEDETFRILQRTPFEDVCVQLRLRSSDELTEDVVKRNHWNFDEFLEAVNAAPDAVWEHIDYKTRKEAHANRS